MRFTLAWLTTLLFIANNLQSQITFHPGIGFSPSVVGEEFGILESTSDPDSAGLATLFIVNNSSSIDSIQSVIVTNVNGDTANEKFWKIWYPLEMSASGSGKNISALLLKGLKSPFKERDSLIVEVNTTKGHKIKGRFLNKSFKLKIANLIPSHDFKQLFIYLRNDDTIQYKLTDVHLNGILHTFPSPNLKVIGGDTISPNQVKIFQLNPTVSMDTLMPLFMELTASDVSTNTTINLVTFQRLVPAEFTFGTWDSPLFNTNQESGRKSLRQLNISTVHGPSNPVLMQDAFDEYHMKVVWEPALNNAVANIQTHSNAEFIETWSIDDEPDLNGKNIDTQLIKNFNYWLYDSNTPSFVNLCTQKKYQRYGWYSDIVSMDHYTDNGAPNVIPLSWITREGSPREAIEYTDVLKRNTEPKRMRSWCQLAVKGTWKFQPNDFINNFQYWAHVMCGAKGIDFFCAKPSTKNEFPALWNEAKRQVEQTNPIKNLLLYAEPVNAVKTRFKGDVETRMLVGTNYAIVVVLNDSIDYFPVNIINQEWRSEVYVKSFEVEFTLPVWVSKQQAYEQTATGRIPLQGLTDLGNNRYRINGTIFKNSRVFVFAPNDNTAPQIPKRLLFSDISSPNKYTLSWAEPHDNFGVKGYIIKVDGVTIDTVPHPIYDAQAAPNICFNGYFEVIAFDEAGNKSQSAVITSPGFITTESVYIIQQPIDNTINAGNTAFFSVKDSGTSTPGFQWQANRGNGWENIYDNNIYSGTGTNTLAVAATQNENGLQLRCLVNATCGSYLVSDSAILTVIGTVNLSAINDNEIVVFPNPSNETFFIKNLHKAHVQLIRIFDLHGQEVKVFYPQLTDEQFDISTLSAGVYHLQLLKSNAVVSKKLVKQ